MLQNLTRRRALGVAMVSTIAAALPWSARAQSYPARALHYVSPYPAGGTNDLVARIVSKRLAERLGQAAVVENRGGAGGTLGTTYVARAAADGHVILNASSGNLTSAPQIIGAAYDPFKDFVPVGFLGHIRFVLAAHPALGVRTLPELIEYAQRNPGKINYGTAGNGTGGHIAGEYLKLRTGIDIVHVPYRGSALALQDAVAGHIQFVLDPLAAAHVKSGALRGLAFTGATTSPDLPGVPSIAQAGVPRWEATNFYVAVVRASTPPEIVQVLNEAFLQIAREPAVQAELQALGVEIQPLSRAEIVRLLLTETATNNRVIEAARLPLANPPA